MDSKPSDSIAFQIKTICRESKERGEKFRPITRQDFPESIPLQGHWTDKQDNLYDYSIDLTDRYFWFSALKGRGRPLNPELIDTSNERKVKNLRTAELVEATEPFFVLILFSEDVCQENLFVYPNGVGVIKELLSSIGLESLRKIYIKSCFLPKDELLAKLKTVKQIELAENIKTARLFKKSEGFPDVRQALTDFMGIDAPTTCRLVIKANFSMETVKEFLRKIYDGRKCRAYSSLSIKGRDENDVNVVFNNDTISKKVVVPAETNQNGIYDSAETERIKQALLEAVYEPQN